MKKMNANLKYQIKSASRALLKNKYFTFLNITGLSLGIAVILLILLWVQDELSYDKFHKNKNEIARTLITKNGDGGPTMLYPLAEIIKEGVPEIKDVTLIVYRSALLVSNGDKSFYENKVIGTDESFLNIFTFPLISGNLSEALSNPHSVVVTQKTAKKYFGEQDPVGQTLRFEGKNSYKVTAVLKDIPGNSHIQFDLLLPLQNFIDGSYPNIKIDNQWGSPSFRCYVLTQPNSKLKEVGEKITQLAHDNKAPHIYKLGRKFELQPLTEIHTHPTGKQWDKASGDIKMIYIFSLIALIILLIACFNFINLSTALIQKRMRTIGFYKIIGANRTQLIAQLLTESFLISFISIGFALLIAKLLMPTFNQLTSKLLDLNLADVQFIGCLMAILIFTGLAAGLYPAIVLSRFKPVVALKGEVSNSGSGLKSNKELLRKSLVIVQFIIAIMLISGTIVINRQFNFAITSSWKLDKGFVMHFPSKENIGREYSSLKTRLLQHPNIKSVSLKDCLPTVVKNNSNGVYWDGKRDELNDTYFERSAISTDYFKTLGIDVVMGREFSDEFGTDSTNSYVIDESLLKMTGYDEPIGRDIWIHGKSKGKIIGVIKNEIFKPIKSPALPVIYYPIPDGREANFGGDVFLRVEGIDPTNRNNGLSALLEFLELEWYGVNKNAPFEFHFLDQTIKVQYDKEQNLSKMVSYFSIFTIFISCLGLLGLVAAISNSRTKEIAIRKVNGARTMQVFTLLLTDFIKLVFVAAIIAVPMAWYAMDKWLQVFVLRIKLSPWIFVFAFLVVAVVAVLTLFMQTYQAASRNPIQSLKYE